MSTASIRRHEFAPPRMPGRGSSLSMAVAAHLVLIAALSSSVNWHRAKDVAVADVFEAELWRSVPQAAAPPPPPPPPPPVAVEAPKPVTAIAPPPPPPAPPPDIAIAKAAEKKAKADAPAKLLEKEKATKLAAKQAEKEAAAAEAVEKIASQTRQQEQLKRMMDLANKGATPVPTAANSAQSSGPSAAYAGRVIARVRPNITFTQEIAGNPTAEVEVRCGPDGTILSRRLIKSSGQKSWDEAVLKAIDKTEILPREADGRMPPIMVLAFSPKS